MSSPSASRARSAIESTTSAIPSCSAHRTSSSPAWRIYGEAGWAFNASGGADPWDGQFGTELSQPGPTTGWTPFLAVNGRVRQENDFSGDMALQCGWLQRGILDQTLRFGAQYYNGKSNQFEFFTQPRTAAGHWHLVRFLGAGGWGLFIARAIDVACAKGLRIASAVEFCARRFGFVARNLFGGKGMTFADQKGSHITGAEVATIARDEVRKCLPWQLAFGAGAPQVVEFTSVSAQLIWLNG